MSIVHRLLLNKHIDAFAIALEATSSLGATSKPSLETQPKYQESTRMPFKTFKLVGDDNSSIQIDVEADGELDTLKQQVAASFNIVQPEGVGFQDASHNGLDSMQDIAERNDTMCVKQRANGRFAHVYSAASLSTATQCDLLPGRKACHSSEPTTRSFQM